MSAKHGSAISFRRRVQLLVCALVAVLGVSSLAAVSANALPPVKETYLALGDSLAFGYSSHTLNENVLTGDQPTDFETGYPNQYLVQEKYHQKGLQLVNDGCPGETSDSLIGNGPLAKGLEEAHVYKIVEAPCKYHNVEKLPLHNEYGLDAENEPASQLEDALKVIGTEAYLGKPVTTISLDIGANDALHALERCETNIPKEFKEKGETKYLEGGKEGKGTEDQNNGYVLEQEGRGDAYYAGVAAHEAEVAYGKGEYAKAGEKQAEAEALGKAAEKKFGEAGALAGSVCVEEEAEVVFPHIGANIAVTLYVLHHGASFGSINYTGRVIFVGQYDSYGRVYKTKGEVESAIKAAEKGEAGPGFLKSKLGELVPGTIGLTASLNEGLKKELTDGEPQAGEEGHEVENACWTGTEGGTKSTNAFNPGLGKEEGPNGSLQKFTNMNNQGKVEFENPETHETEKLYDGPDIHPTLMGYKDMAKLMKLDCG